MPGGLFSPDALAPYVQQALLEEVAARQAPAAPPKTGMGLGATLATLLGQGADIGTTLPMVASDRYREGNPIGLPAILAMKAGLLATPWLFKKFGMPRKAADITGYAIGAAGAVPAAMNLRTLSR